MYRRGTAQASTSKERVWMQRDGGMLLEVLTSET